MSGVIIRSIVGVYASPFAGLNALFHTSKNACAARKGTREKARKKKVKVEVKKVAFVPHNLRNLEKLRAMQKSLRSVDSMTEDPIDKVFACKHFKTITYPITEAVQFHREVNHPTIRNRPDAAVNVTIELNMVAEKKTRFIDSFSRIVNVPHPFGTYEDRTLLALAKNPEEIQAAMAAGADLAGGLDLVQKIQVGELSLHDFKYVIGHPSILPELVPLRGLLKRKFPAAKSGTLGSDLDVMVQKFKRGLQYKCEKDDNEHDLGLITVQIGDLTMSETELEGNFAALVRDVEAARPKRAGDFITWVWCHAAPSPEKIKIDFNSYLEPA